MFIIYRQSHRENPSLPSTTLHFLPHSAPSSSTHIQGERTRGGGRSRRPEKTTNMAQFGDTTQTKVFVGGLAWETQEKALREHFQRYGDIHEAVIIYDKITGRSKGYGFVTFKEAEAARRACEDATPVINGRRANCNIASLGVASRRARAPHQQQGVASGASRVVTTPPPQASNGQWYYPQGGAPHPPAFQYHGPPFYATYGYTPSYVADMSYNAKLSLSSGGPYVFPHAPYAPQGGMLATNGVLPVYPYHHHHHQYQAMAVAPHSFPSVAAVPATISKPTAMPQAAVEQVTG